LRTLRERVEGRNGPRAQSWVHLHTYRHTAATRLFRGGWNAVQVQRFLGHADPGFTLRTDVHLLAEDLPEVPFGSLAPVREIRRVA
jgi:integrase